MDQICQKEQELENSFEANHSRDQSIEVKVELDEDRIQMVNKKV